MDDEHEASRTASSVRAARPAARYGDVRPPWHRNAARAAVVAAAAAGISWVLWAASGSASQDVRWKDVGFEVVDSSEVVVTFDVIKDPGASATCRLEALNRQYAVVGVAEVRVGTADDRAVRLTEPVTTSERAVTGLVKRCEVA